jgi:hypothetical protein
MPKLILGKYGHPLPPQHFVDRANAWQNHWAIFYGVLHSLQRSSTTRVL